MEPLQGKRHFNLNAVDGQKKSRVAFKSPKRLIDSINFEGRVPFVNSLRELTSRFQRKPNNVVTKDIYTLLKQNFHRKLVLVERVALRRLSECLKKTHPHTANLVKSFSKKDDRLYYKRLPQDMWKLIFRFLNKTDYYAVKEFHKDRLVNFQIDWSNIKKLHTWETEKITEPHAKRFLSDHVQDLKRYDLLSSSCLKFQTNWNVEHLLLSNIEETKKFNLPNLVSMASPEKLRSLTIINSNIKGVAHLTAITKLSGLQKLHFSYLGMVENNKIEEFCFTVNRLSNLTTLSFRNSNLDGISNLLPTQLRKLNISYSQIKEIGWLSRLTNLTYLRLAISVKINLDTQLINQLTSLRTLILNVDFQPQKFCLNNLTQLTRLDMPYCPIKDDDKVKLLCANNTRLRELDLRRTFINNSVLIAVARLNFLEKLDISENGFRGEDALAPLTALTKLRVLRVDKIKAGMQFLRQMTSLVHLTCEGNEQNGNLELLTSLLSLRYLSFVNTKIGNGVHYLTQLKNLRELYLESSEIKDVTALAKMTTLSVLNVRRNNLSFDNIRALIQLPRLDILFYTNESGMKREQMHELDCLYNSSRVKRWEFHYL